ncbi:hypothetical protein HDU76_004959 [Blyttiomyces sp. JEL0837]|nr:hypothetical protein HDU76_004959 [Blyttiomyces sp. JEL0837]
MGCHASSLSSVSAEVAESKASKQRATLAIEYGDRWRVCLTELLGLLEKCGFIGALWGEEEKDPNFAETFKRLSLYITEVSVMSRACLSTLDSHIELLNDLFALQREHHDALKRVASERIRYQNTRQKVSEARARASGQISRHTSLIGRPGRNGSVFKRKAGSLKGGNAGNNRLVEPEEMSFIGVEMLDRGPEIQARLIWKERLRTENVRWERFVKAKIERILPMIVDLLTSLAGMWISFSEIFGRMRVICQEASANMDSSVPPPRPRTGSIMIEGPLALPTNEKKIKILMKWCTYASQVVDMWSQSREMEVAHAKSCSDWWVNDASAHLTAHKDDSENMGPGSLVSEGTLSLQALLQAWISLFATLTPTTDSGNANNGAGGGGSTNGGSNSDQAPENIMLSMNMINVPPQKNLTKNMQWISNAMSALPRLLGQIHEREIEVSHHIREVNKLSRIAAQSARKVAKDTRGSGRRPSMHASSLIGGSAGPAGSRAAKNVHKLETARYRLDKMVADNKVFRRTGLVKVHGDLWRCFELNARIISTGYKNAAVMSDQLISFSAAASTILHDSVVRPKLSAVSTPIESGQHSSVGQVPMIEVLSPQTTAPPSARNSRFQYYRDPGGEPGVGMSKQSSSIHMDRDRGVANQSDVRDSLDGRNGVNGSNGGSDIEAVLPNMVMDDLPPPTASTPTQTQGTKADDLQSAVKRQSVSTIEKPLNPLPMIPIDGVSSSLPRLDEPQNPPIPGQPELPPSIPATNASNAGDFSSTPPTTFATHNEQIDVTLGNSAVEQAGVVATLRESISGRRFSETRAAISPQVQSESAQEPAKDITRRDSKVQRPSFAENQVAARQFAFPGKKDEPVAVTDEAASPRASSVEESRALQEGSSSQKMPTGDVQLANAGAAMPARNSEPQQPALEKKPSNSLLFESNQHPTLFADTASLRSKSATNLQGSPSRGIALPPLDPSADDSWKASSPSPKQSSLLRRNSSRSLKGPPPPPPVNPVVLSQLQQASELHYASGAPPPYQESDNQPAPVDQKVPLSQTLSSESSQGPSSAFNRFDMPSSSNQLRQVSTDSVSYHPAGDSVDSHPQQIHQKPPMLPPPRPWTERAPLTSPMAAVASPLREAHPIPKHVLEKELQALALVGPPKTVNGSTSPLPSKNATSSNNNASESGQGKQDDYVSGSASRAVHYSEQEKSDPKGESYYTWKRHQSGNQNSKFSTSGNTINEQFVRRQHSNAGSIGEQVVERALSVKRAPPPVPKINPLKLQPNEDPARNHPAYKIKRTPPAPPNQTPRDPRPPSASSTGSASGGSKSARLRGKIGVR